MLRDLKQALTDLREGVPATKRMVLAPTSPGRPTFRAGERPASQVTRSPNGCARSGALISAGDGISQPVNQKTDHGAEACRRNGATERAVGAVDQPRPENVPRTRFSGAGVTPTVPHGMLPVMAGLRLRRQDGRQHVLRGKSLVPPRASSPASARRWQRCALRWQRPRGRGDVP
jgi:hypothetical protein